MFCVAADDTIELPAIARKIESASLLNGGNVTFTNRAGLLVFTIPHGQLDADDTVIKVKTGWFCHGLTSHGFASRLWCNCLQHVSQR